MYTKRRPTYVSPTSLHIFESSRELYAYQYILDPRPERPPQIPAMALGSAVDARLKADWHPKFHPHDPKYDFEAIFESQVEPHLRDEVLEPSSWIVSRYKECGAYDRLMGEFQTAKKSPVFEIDLAGTIEGIPLFGKPDIHFINKYDWTCTYDMKVNGFYSKNRTSVMRGYLWGYDFKKQKIVVHKDCKHQNILGVVVNQNCPLELANKKFADQLLIYSWLCGVPIGSSRCIVGIEQFVGNKSDFRIAQHRSQIKPTYHYELLDRLSKMWQAVVSDQVMSDEQLYKHQPAAAENLEWLDRIIAGGAE
jgi:hypothetical protein